MHLQRSNHFCFSVSMQVGMFSSSLRRSRYQRQGAMQRPTGQLSPSHRRRPLCVGDVWLPMRRLPQVLRPVWTTGSQTNEERSGSASVGVGRDEKPGGNYQHRPSHSGCGASLLYGDQPSSDIVYLPWMRTLHNYHRMMFYKSGC